MTTAMTGPQVQLNFSVVALVALVAIVGLVALVLSGGGSTSAIPGVESAGQINLAGDARMDGGTGICTEGDMRIIRGTTYECVGGRWVFVSSQRVTAFNLGAR